MNYNVYEILSVIFFVLSGFTAGCAVFYFLRHQIIHVIPVLTGRRAKKQIARWNESMLVKENATERLSKMDDSDKTSVINGDEKVTSILNNTGEEATSILYENQEKRMIHSAYIISLSGELEPVKN